MPGIDPAAYLNSLSALKDEEIDLACAALCLAMPFHPGLSLERYFSHLEKLSTGVGARHGLLLKEGAKDDAATRLAALKHVLADQESYQGDRDTYDDLQNADLVRVIDRRKGMPIALAILYIHTGRTQGWDIEGLNFPGHFICRLGHEGQRLIFDPFDRCALLDAAGLRRLLKESHGPDAELSADYYLPAGNRETLIRLQNNIKLRQIEAEEYEAALATVEVMRRIDPGEYRLLLDAGVLYARTGQSGAAINALEGYIEKAPSPADRRDAELLLRQIRLESQ